MQPSTVTEENLASVGLLLDSVFRRAHGVADQQIFTDFPLVFDRSNWPNCRVLILDGKVVSHAAIWPRQWVVEGEKFKVAGISAVATHPDYRKRGLAAILVRDLHRIMHEQEYDFGLLWTGVPNFYAKLDWEITVPNGCMGWLRGTNGSPTLITRSEKQPTCEVAVTAYEEHKHLEGIVRIHDAEPARFTRTRRENSVLLSLPKMRVWVAVRPNESVVAYLVHGQSHNKRGFSEYGGSPKYVMQLVRHALRAEPTIDFRRFLTFSPQTELIRWLTEACIAVEPLQCSKGSGCEMVYVINRQRFTPHVQSRLFTWGLDQL